MIAHGLSAYVNARCRCEVCVSARGTGRARVFLAEVDRECEALATVTSIHDQLTASLELVS